MRAITTTLDEAKALGAMALFGEKYGDVVRMVEVGGGDYSRELCGGTHVRSTAEIGPFRILSETSSSANVRRIEAVTGPAAVELLREHDALLGEIARELRTRPQDAPAAVEALAKERKKLEKALKQGAGGAAAANGLPDVEALAAQAAELGRGNRAHGDRRGSRREAPPRSDRSPQGEAGRSGDPARRRAQTGGFT